MNQPDKENTIRNSKLQMSIKPFTTVREDLAKSKSVDKTRKGITRINSLAPSQPLVQPPLSHNSNHPQTQKPNWQSQPAQPQSAQSNYSFQTNLTPNTISIPSSQKGPHFPYSQQPPQVVPVIQHSDELYKMEMLQKQITVLERQNIQIAAQRSQWKDKCKQLFQVNEQGMGKIKQLQQQVLFMQKSLDDRQLFVKEKQKCIKELAQASRIDKLKIAQTEERCRKLGQRVQQKAQKLKQKQEQIRIMSMKPNEIRYDQKYWEQKYRGVTQQYKILEEEHRKLLIKSSASFQQKQLLETKIRSLTYQFQQQFDTNRQLTQQLRQLQFQVEQLEQDALFGRACRKQLQQLSHLRSANTELEQLRQELEYRVRDLENRRLNQIQFHQEQIKRILNSESSKYETIIRVYKQQRDKAVQEKQNLTTHYESTIENIHKDYLTVVNQMKEEIVVIKAAAMDKTISQDQKQREKQRERERERELQRSRNRQRQRDRELQRERSRQRQADRQRMKQRQREQAIQALQKKYTKILCQKQQQITTLLQKLQQITQDNKFIFQRLQQQKLKSIQSIPTPPPSSSNNHQLPCSSEYYGFESELQKLQSNNIGLSEKLSNYEIQLMKLGDKIQMYQIQIEKYKSKEEASQRKIRHYIEEMEYVQKGREKQIQDKVKCVQQLNQLKLQLKSKTSQQKHQHDKLQLQSEQLAQQQTQINIQITQIQQQQKNIRQITQQLQRQKEQNNKLQQTYKAYQDVKNTLDIVNIQLSKFEECYKLAKEQCQILREKERVREERRKGDQDRKKGEEDKGRGARWNKYSDIAVILGVDIQSIDEQAILLILTKSIKSIVEGRKDDKIRIQKMQVQYTQLQETQNATRLLAQKYQQKCLQLQRLLIRMQEAHKDKLVLVKQDYDIVYSKYLKYRNIVVAHNNGVKERSRSREKERSREKDKERDVLYKQTVLKDKQRQRDREREREKRDKIARR